MENQELVNPCRWLTFFITLIQLDIYWYMFPGVCCVTTWTFQISMFIFHILVPIAPYWYRSHDISDVVPSSTKPNMFEHPEHAIAWLKHFSAQNSALLHKLQVNYLKIFIFFVFLFVYRENFWSSLWTVKNHWRLHMEQTRINTCWLFTDWTDRSRIESVKICHRLHRHVVEGN